MRKLTLAGSLALALGIVASAATAAVPSYGTFELQARNNLLVNDNSWNMPPGSSISNPSAAINDAGQVAFPVLLVPIDGSLSRYGAGVWFGGHGAGGIVVRHDPPAGDPEDPPMQFISPTVDMNASGKVIYYTSVDGRNPKLMVFDPATSQAGAVSSLPLTPTVYSNQVIANDGVIGYQGTFGAGRGFASVGAAGGVLHAADAQVIPTSNYVYMYSPAMNNLRQIAGKVSVGDYNHNEVRLFNADQSSVLYAADKATDPASIFRKFDNGLAVNDQGQIAIVAQLDNGGARAVYRIDADGAKTEIARVDAAGTIRNIESFAPAINNSGLVVFRARDANGQAVYAGDGERLVRVIGKADRVRTDRGLGQLGQHIDNPDSQPIFSGAPSVNGHGDIVVVAGLHPNGDTQTEWGNGVIVAYANEAIFADGFEGQ